MLLGKMFTFWKVGDKSLGLTDRQGSEWSDWEGALDDEQPVKVSLVTATKPDYQSSSAGTHTGWKESQFL